MSERRGVGLVLGMSDQALSLVELNFHGPCFLVLRLLQMHCCCLTKLGAFRVAGGQWLGRAELLTKCTDFGTDVFRTAVCIFRHAPLGGGRCATGAGQPTPIERIGVADAARPGEGTHGGAATPTVYRGMNLCSRNRVVVPALSVRFSRCAPCRSRTRAASI